MLYFPTLAKANKKLEPDLEPDLANLWLTSKSPQSFKRPSPENPKLFTRSEAVLISLMGVGKCQGLGGGKKRGKKTATVWNSAHLDLCCRAPSFTDMQAI